MPTLATALLTLALAAPQSPAGETPSPAALSGRWEGAISIMGAELAITVEFATPDGALAATIDIPQQGAKGLPLKNVSYRPPRVRFELPTGPGVATFDGERRGDEIAGTFSQGGAAGTFRLGRRAGSPVPAEAPRPYREEEVAYATPAGSFACTLTLPPHPLAAVALLTGSGPQNRDEELLGFKPFRLIADHLSRAGVATLRCDDRGVGGTTAGRAEATTSDFADDAVAAVAFLRARPELAGLPVGLLGHSEGGVVAPLAATRTRGVAFLVLVSALGTTGERVLLDQAELIGRAGGASDADVRAEAALQMRLFAATRSGAGWDAVTAEARALALTKLEALPEEQRRALGDLGAYADRAIAGQLAMARSPWFKYFLDYDPAVALTKVRCPVLATFGEKDLQVPAGPNRDAIAAALARGGNTSVTTRVFAGANHLYQKSVTGSPSEYATLAKEFVPELLPAISNWIRTVAATPH